MTTLSFNNGVKSMVGLCAVVLFVSVVSVVLCWKRIIALRRECQFHHQNSEYWYDECEAARNEVLKLQSLLNTARHDLHEAEQQLGDALTENLGRDADQVIDEEEERERILREDEESDSPFDALAELSE